MAIRILILTDNTSNLQGIIDAFESRRAVTLVHPLDASLLPAARETAPAAILLDVTHDLGKAQSIQRTLVADETFSSIPIFGMGGELKKATSYYEDLSSPSSIAAEILGVAELTYGFGDSDDDIFDNMSSDGDIFAPLGAPPAVPPKAPPSRLPPPRRPTPPRGVPVATASAPPAPPAPPAAPAAPPSVPTPPSLSASGLRAMPPIPPAAPPAEAIIEDIAAFEPEEELLEDTHSDEIFEEAIAEVLGDDVVEEDDADILEDGSEDVEADEIIEDLDADDVEVIEDVQPDDGEDDILEPEFLVDATAGDHEHAELQQRVDDQAREILRLHEELNDALSQQQAHATADTEVQGTLDALQKENAALQEGKEKADQDLQELQAQYDALHEESQKADARIQDLMEQNTDLGEQLDALRSTSQEHEAAVEELTTERDGLVEEHATLTRTNEELMSNLETAIEEIKRLEAAAEDATELDHWKSQYAGLEAEYDALAQQRDEILQLSSELENAFGQSEIRAAQYVDALEKADAAIRALQDDLGVYAEAAHRAREQHQDHQAAIKNLAATLETSLAAAKTVLDTSMSALPDTSWEAAYNAYEAVLDAMSEDVAAAQEDDFHDADTPPAADAVAEGEDASQDLETDASDDDDAAEANADDGEEEEKV